MKNILLAFAFFAIPVFSFAQLGLGQLEKPEEVVWYFDLEPKEGDTYVFVATAMIQKGYHIFHLDAGGDGTLTNTEFSFEDDVETDAAWTATPNPKKVVIEIIEGDIFWHEMKVTFQKEIQATDDMTSLKGEVYYQVCNEEKCLPPATAHFNLPLKR